MPSTGTMHAWSRRACRPGMSLLLLALWLSACGEPRIPQQPPTGIVADYRSGSAPRQPLPLPDEPAGATGRVEHHADGMIAIAGLPWYRQGKDRTCAQAVIAALLRYWGQDVTYPEVVAAMNPANVPTDVPRVAAYFHRRGLPATVAQPADLAFLKARIRQGRPVIVVIDLGAINVIHYVTVKGFNDRTGHLLLSDPVNGPNVLMACDEFLRRWENPSLQGLSSLAERYERVAVDVGPADPCPMAPLSEEEHTGSLAARPKGQIP